LDGGATEAVKRLGCWALLKRGCSCRDMVERDGDLLGKSRMLFCSFSSDGRFDRVELLP